jgi:guanine deaminase
MNFMTLTNSLALKSIELGGGPFGCVIVKDNQIVSANHNRVVLDNDPTQHAEIVTIREACKKLNTYDLKDCQLYTSCEPCPMCLGAIYWARIKEVYYGNTKEDAEEIGFSDKFIYDELEKKHEDKSLHIKNIGRNITLKSFQQWSDKVDKQLY